MNNTNTGGPAFPVFPDTGSGHAAAFKGMTLRDYFAANAMQATVQAWILKSQYPMTDLMVAVNAYSVADAMLEAREQ